MPDIIVIFGAAIGADGQPSGTLRRRVEGACRFGAIFRDPVYLVTGGVGRYGPAEADVMRDLLLGYGVPASRILVEDKATDTLSSAVLCAAILKSRPERGMIHVCSSTYHIPRCRMLLAMLGLKTEAVPMRSDRKVLGTGKWLYYLLREAAALPYDAIVMAVKRPFL
jgi:uncharacterized SAM-binding protein YcdF (DUF218 family)